MPAGRSTRRRRAVVDARGDSNGGVDNAMGTGLLTVVEKKRVLRLHLVSWYLQSGCEAVGSRST